MSLWERVIPWAILLVVGSWVLWDILQIQLKKRKIKPDVAGFLTYSKLIDPIEGRTVAQIMVVHLAKKVTAAEFEQAFHETQRDLDKEVFQHRNPRRHRRRKW